MEFKGRIYKVMPVQSGTSSQGKEYRRQEFVFEYFENASQRWSDKILLSAMNDRIDQYNLHEGDEVVIGFANNVNEHNGRYYNSPSIYKFEKVTQVSQDAPAAPTEATKEEEKPKSADNAKEDDMPF